MSMTSPRDTLEGPGFVSTFTLLTIQNHHDPKHGAALVVSAKCLRAFGIFLSFLSELCEVSSEILDFRDFLF